MSNETCGKGKTICSLVRGSDPKTFRKGMWLLIETITNLEVYLVSFLLYLFSIVFIFYQFIRFSIQFKGDVDNDCLLPIDWTNFMMSKPLGKLFWNNIFWVLGLR